MDFEFTPEPAPEEREALVAALERLLREDADPTPAAYRSEWRALGILENLGADYATARLRKTRGASRA